MPILKSAIFDIIIPTAGIFVLNDQPDLTQLVELAEESIEGLGRILDHQGTHSWVMSNTGDSQISSSHSNYARKHAKPFSVSSCSSCPKFGMLYKQFTSIYFPPWIFFERLDGTIWLRPRCWIHAVRTIVSPYFFGIQKCSSDSVLSEFVSYSSTSLIQWLKPLPILLSFRQEFFRTQRAF